MDWAVSTPGGGVALNVTLDESFLAWLRDRSSVPDVMIDPYRTTTIGGESQVRWRDELKRIGAEHMAAVTSRLATRPGLPADRTARERVVGTLVERELAATPEWVTLGEAVAALELALELGGVIVARGD